MSGGGHDITGNSEHRRESEGKTEAMRGSRVGSVRRAASLEGGGQRQCLRGGRRRRGQRSSVLGRRAADRTVPAALALIYGGAAGRPSVYPEGR